MSVAVRAHIENSVGIATEVIVSDYGSRNPSEIKTRIEPLGARVIRTETDEPWSRSAALNAGVREARGRVIITTDADIIFSPACYRQVTESVSRNPNALYLVQCRDLPPGYDADEFASQLDARGSEPEWWGELDAVSTVRPRWGMGGLAGFARTAFFELNGYDERMRIWGGEDTDFAQRFNRLGYPCRWLSGRETRIYHIWHPPSQKKAYESAEEAAAVEKNRGIVKTDASIARNLPASMQVVAEPPLVSIVIPTFRRGQLLRDCLRSCRYQTFTDFEVIIVENGDSNVAEPIVAEFEDRRFRFFKTDRKGAAAARNIGLDHVRGRYVVVHDDDDIMLSTRVEDHLNALHAGVSGSYGGWIDFDHDSGQILRLNPGKTFSYDAVLFGGRVLTHGCLMLDSRIFRRFRYDESASAGIDYGFIALLARNGLKLAHTSRYGILRRMHDSNLTTTQSAQQKSAGLKMAELLRGELDEHTRIERKEAARQARQAVCDNALEAVVELARLYGETPLDCLRRNGAYFHSLESLNEYGRTRHIGAAAGSTVLKELSPGLADLLEASG